VLKRKRSRIQGSKGQSRFFPFTDYSPKEIVKDEGIPLKKRGPVCETRQIKLKRASSG
jgi:hypothetical protein